MDDLPFKSYRSHKVVGALPICWIERVVEMRPIGQPLRPVKEPAIVRLDFGSSLDFKVGSLVDPDPSLFARYSPLIGDYLVRYDDGYLSISPKAAFEAGYTEI